jgi:hypothetical protein|tara:strand:+ start:4716 stop:5036 length:321 start_codon:yes stop_codon:yes gene_type:complete
MAKKNVKSLSSNHKMILAVVVIIAAVAVMNNTGTPTGNVVEGSDVYREGGTCKQGYLDTFQCETFLDGSATGREQRLYQYNNCQQEYFSAPTACENGCNLETGRCN